MAFEYVGIIGMLCIVAAWVPQTIRTIRTKITGMEPRFLWLYLVGSASLMAYAISISDLIFMTLNGIATIFDIINIYYYYCYEAKAKTKAARTVKAKRKKK